MNADVRALIQNVVGGFLVAILSFACLREESKWGHGLTIDNGRIGKR